MKKLIIISLFILGCTSDDDFRKGKNILESEGYTNVENTGYKHWCCGEDNFSTGFRAKDKKGNIVKGCFCSTAFKGITIRYE